MRRIDLLHGEIEQTNDASNELPSWLMLLDALQRQHIILIFLKSLMKLNPL